MSPLQPALKFRAAHPHQGLPRRFLSGRKFSGFLARRAVGDASRQRRLEQAGPRKLVAAAIAVRKNGVASLAIAVRKNGVASLAIAVRKDGVASLAMG
jgi:hypothetical protein